MAKCICVGWAIPGISACVLSFLFKFIIILFVKKKQGKSHFYQHIFFCSVSDWMNCLQLENVDYANAIYASKIEN